MNLQNCKLNFMNLQTNLAILGSTKFIGIVNQLHYIDNQFNLNFQPITCCKEIHEPYKFIYTLF